MKKEFGWNQRLKFLNRIPYIKLLSKAEMSSSYRWVVLWLVEITGISIEFVIKLSNLLADILEQLLPNEVVILQLFELELDTISELIVFLLSQHEDIAWYSAVFDVISKHSGSLNEASEGISQCSGIKRSADAETWK